MPYGSLRHSASRRQGGVLPFDSLQLAAKITPWRVWALACGTGLVASLVAAGLALQAQRQSQEFIDLRAHVLPPVPVASAPTVGDFTASLSRAQQASRIVSVLEQAASAVGAAVSNVQITEHAATASTLGRLEAVIGLRGSYAAHKQVLMELHARLPGAAVRQLRMRPADNNPEVIQATITLSVWSASASASTSAAAATIRVQR